MKNWFKQTISGTENDNADWPSNTTTPNLLDGLQGLWQWDELAAEIGQESQARLAIVGLPGAGKSMLFNRLRGWHISGEHASVQVEGAFACSIESYGTFLLVDLPHAPQDIHSSGEETLMTLGDPALLVYIVNAEQGVQSADYRWVSLLRATGRPLLVTLNKTDRFQDDPAALEKLITDAESRLGMSALPISAQTGLNVEGKLLPAMLDAVPKLAVILGREIQSLRRQAARRVIRQAALLTGMLSAQPLPVLDVPFQAMIQSGVVMRVGAAYGHPPAGGINKEIVGAVAGTLGLHYLMQTIVKFIPFLGWAISAVIGFTATLLIGETAIRYYEAGATIPFPQWLRLPTLHLPKRPLPSLKNMRFRPNFPKWRPLRKSTAQTVSNLQDSEGDE